MEYGVFSTYIANIKDSESQVSFWKIYSCQINWKIWFNRLSKKVLSWLLGPKKLNKEVLPYVWAI